MALTGIMDSFEPSRRTDPFPNCFSIWLNVALRLRWRSCWSMINVFRRTNGETDLIIADYRRGA